MHLATMFSIKDFDLQPYGLYMKTMITTMFSIKDFDLPIFICFEHVAPQRQSGHCYHILGYCYRAIVVLFCSLSGGMYSAPPMMNRYGMGLPLGHTAMVCTKFGLH